MIMQVVEPRREREDRAENIGAGVQGQINEVLLGDNIELVEVVMDDYNIEVVEVAMDDDNIEVVEVAMDDENVEIVEVAMDGNDVEIVEVLLNDDELPAQIEVVSDEDNFVGVFDISPLYVIGEVSNYFVFLLLLI